MTNTPRAWIGLTIALLTMSTALCAVAATPDAPVRLNDLTGIVDGAGQPISRSALQGQVVVLDIWASWCSPCVAQLPELQALAVATRGKGIRVVPVSIDAGGALAAVRAYARKNIRALPLYVGSAASVMERFGVDGIPNTLVFDPQGNLVARFRGGQSWTKETMIALAARMRSDRHLQK
ncbi:MAG TPA: TlpA disulfide reductase family protein [Steroidobacteraceae bacterium]|nr:TlpA disulfide reductase family protein [Steroidobacteraceae bacterium]